MPPQKLNQLTIGSIGEAKILNPILSTTTADSEVTELIFHGLVRYDENISYVPDLAESWEIAQTSTIFFGSEAAADEAMQLLAGHRADWSKWGLVDAKRDGTRLVLRLSQAGTAFEEKVLPLVAGAKPLPVAFVRININEGAKLDGQPLTSRGVLDRLHEPAVLARFVNTSSEFDLVVAGDTADLVARISKMLRSDAGKEALGSCAVAESFPILNEPEILFRIRRGVRWHDGKPFTAGDVEFTYRMIMDEEIASPRRADYELVRNVEVTGDDTVRIVYRKPYAPCLGSWAMGMLPRHILEGHKSAWWAANFNRSPVGTGPFKFDRWVSNQYIRLCRNDDYWEGKPHLDYITIRTIPDMVALRLLFESGEIDFWGVDPHANKKFLEDPGFDVFQRPSPSYNYIGWNLKRPVFQDVRVRQALAHAVNVPDMIKYIMYGQGEPSTGPFPPQMWFANPNVTPFAYDPAKAEAMLDEAGWKRGPDGIRQKNGQKFEFTLITNHPNEIRKDIATLVQSDLKKIGIKVDVQLYEWAVFISEYINKQDFDAMVLGWSLGYDYDQYQLWHSSQTKPGMLNHCSYVNKEVDRWLGQARSEFDQDKAREVLWKLHRQIYEDQPYLFLFVPMSTGAMRKGVFRVRRPDGKGGWIDEEVRSTKLGFRVYQDWWYRVGREP